MCSDEDVGFGSIGVNSVDQHCKIYYDPSIQQCVSERFRQFYRTNLFTDVTLKSRGISINAHKLILAASSAFFEAKFNYEAQIQVTEVELDCNCTLLKTLVDYIYFGKIVITRASIRGLMELQDFFQIASLRNLITLFIQTQMIEAKDVFTDALKLKKVADFYRYHDLATNLFHHVRSNFILLLDKTEFLDTSYELLLECLQSDFLVYGEEDELLLGVCRWANTNSARIIYLETLLNHIDPSYVKRWRETEMKVLQITSGHRIVKDWFKKHEDSRLKSSKDGCSRFKTTLKPALLCLGGIGDTVDNRPSATVDCILSLYREKWRPLIPTVDITSPYSDCAEPLPLMHHPRLRPLVACDGTNVYVAGGGVHSVEMYCSQSNTWLLLPELPSILEIDSATIAVLDGSLYLLIPVQNERSSYKARFMVLYKNSKAWHDLQAPQVATKPLHLHLISVLSSLHLLMSGKTNEEKLIWRYDVSMDLWNVVGVQPLVGLNHICACIAFNHTIFVVFNASVLYSYNTITQEWRRKSDPSPDDRSGVSSQYDSYVSSKLGSEIVLGDGLNNVILFSLTGRRSILINNRRLYSSLAHVNLGLHSPPGL